MTKSILLLLFLLGMMFQLYGQRTNDTIVERKHYSFIDRYSNGSLKILGNYADTIKVGTWTYYLLNGNKLATGQYKLGHKIGRWTYFPDSKAKTIRIKYKDYWSEKIENDSIGNIVLYDFVLWKPCMWTFKNGCPIKTARLL